MDNNRLYYCTCGGSSAMGYPCADGFMVLKGSVISPKVAPSFECAGKFYFRLRNRLIEEGVIQIDVFQRDYCFSSATGAADVIVGWTISGKVAWKTTDQQ